MRRVLAAVMKGLEWLAATAFLGVVLLSALKIALRYIFGEAIFWLPDMVRVLFIWSVFPAAAVMYYRGEHIVVDFLVKKAKQKTQDALAVMVHLVMLVFLGILVYQGVVVSKLRMMQIFTVLPLPTGYAYLAIPVAAAAMFMASAMKVIELLKKPAGAAESPAQEAEHS